MMRNPDRLPRLVLAVLGLAGAGIALAEAQEEAAPTDPAETVVAAEAVAPLAEEAVVPETVNPVRADRTPARVVVIPVRDEIAKPVLYVIRRGLKSAIENEADLVVLDMETPGGSLGVTFEIMEALDRFDGATATYVNEEAVSAGAFISAMTDDIYFAPHGVIGAAAPVMSTGGEIDETMKQKVVSYLRARIRAISEGHRYRGEVISAMIDADYELKIGDEVLKEKGELLSLTATEAAKTYGDPATPLLAAGIADSVTELLESRFGPGGYAVETLETTWSENLAAYLNSISPLLMGLGFLGIFIEFKTPGFGVFGILGGILMLIVFFGHNVAGLSGQEPMLVFALGAALVLLELLFFPGVILVALTGIVLMLGSLVWSMIDIWPNEPIRLSGDLLMTPVMNLALGLVVAVAGAVILSRVLPSGWFWDKLVLNTAVGGGGGTAAIPAEAAPSLVGRRGVAATDLFPSGQVEIDGQRYEAKVGVGFIDAGTPIVVRRETEFGLTVVAVKEDEA